MPALTPVSNLFSRASLPISTGFANREVRVKLTCTVRPQEEYMAIALEFKVRSSSKHIQAPKVVLGLKTILVTR